MLRLPAASHLALSLLLTGTLVLAACSSEPSSSTESGTPAEPAQVSTVDVAAETAKISKLIDEAVKKIIADGEDIPLGTIMGPYKDLEDPWGQKYGQIVDRQNKKITFSSWGPDTEPNTDDDIVVERSW